MVPERYGMTRRETGAGVGWLIFRVIRRQEPRLPKYIGGFSLLRAQMFLAGPIAAVVLRFCTKMSFTTGRLATKRTHISPASGWFLGGAGLGSRPCAGQWCSRSGVRSVAPVV